MNDSRLRPHGLLSPFASRLIPWLASWRPTTPALAARVTVPTLAAAVTLVTTLALALTLGDALLSPGRYGILVGHRPTGHIIARWVLLGGPAWSAGLRPGQTIVPLARHAPGVSGAQDALAAWVGGHRLLLPRAALAPTVWALLDAGLGVLLLALGLLVVRKSIDRATGLAFWRTCLCAGGTLALIPASEHGRAWALFAQALAVRLFVPSLLSLALALPARRATPRPGARRAFVLWLPAVALVPPYLALWIWPAWTGLAAVMPPLDDVVLGGYLLAACGVLIARLRRAATPLERAQGRWLAAGVAGGVLPFVLLTLLPLVVAGRDLVPAEVSALALLLLPVCLACAIVRTELFGIAGMIRRGTLRALTYGLLLGVGATATGYLTALGPARWSWSPAACAAGACVLTALVVVTVGRRLYRALERLLFRDVYDVANALHALGDELVLADDPPILSAGLVQRLTHLLDVTDVVALTAHAQWMYAHPQARGVCAGQEAILTRARALVTAPSATAVRECVAGPPVLLLLIRTGGAVSHVAAVLCLGPKRSGDRYTARDQLLLDLLGRHLALLLTLWPARDHAVGLGHSAGPAEPLPARAGATDIAGVLVAPALSARQREVLRLLAAGLSNKEIADRLGMGQKTVDTHVGAVYRRLDVHTRLQAVERARHLRLLDGV